MIRIFSLWLCYFIGHSTGIAQDVNYTQHIAPIIRQHCIACHQADRIGPMSFTTYEEVSSYAAMIGFVTKTHYMPPWKIEQPRHTFARENRLSQTEIQQIQQWINSGLPKGPPEKEKLDRDTPTLPQLQNPDLIYSMQEAFEQYGVYYDQYRVFVIPTDLKEEVDISAIEFVPGNGKIVRGCTISVDTTDKVNPLDEWDPQYGYFSFGELGFIPMESHWYTWTPNQGRTVYPDGYARRLPKGAKLLVHIHYGPTGVPLPDSSHIRLKMARKPHQKIWRTAPLLNPYVMTNDTFALKAGEVERYHAQFTVPFDLELQGIAPHSHFLARRWEIFTVSPDRSQSEVLLKITDWDFHWKQMYTFKKPKILRKGTIIHSLVEYDNTANNPLNPSDPPRDMAWGKRMFEEMMLAFFEFTPLQQSTHFFIDINRVNNTDSQFSFAIQSHSSQVLQCELQNLQGEFVRSLLPLKEYPAGKIAVTADFTSLPKGNYQIVVSNPERGDRAACLLVHMEESLFD